MTLRRFDDVEDIFENYKSTKQHEHLGDENWEYSGKPLDALWDDEYGDEIEE